MPNENEILNRWTGWCGDSKTIGLGSTSSSEAIAADRGWCWPLAQSVMLLLSKTSICYRAIHITIWSSVFAISHSYCCLSKPFLRQHS